MCTLYGAAAGNSMPADHSRITPSAQPVTTTWPSHATDVMAPGCPLIRRRRRLEPASVDQSRSRWSAPPVTMRASLPPTNAMHVCGAPAESTRAPEVTA